jgi:hypothetical protein
MDRQPIVNGKFYPGTRAEWEKGVVGSLNQDTSGPIRTPVLTMLPHAGHVFSGGVTGMTLARARLKDRMILLGPNHSGQGQSLALWPDGSWLLPEASLKVDQALAQDILDNCPAVRADTTAHQFEHSLEVILPFLWSLNKEASIVPICVSEPDLSTLIHVGRDLAQVIKRDDAGASVIVSSDMSHFISQKEAEVQDQKALQAIQAIDPEQLYTVVRDNNISMCGVLPMTIGLSLARELGATQAEVVQYATSGDVIGDYSHVVGYAGVLVW